MKRLIYEVAQDTALVERLFAVIKEWRQHRLTLSVPAEHALRAPRAASCRCGAVSRVVSETA